MNPVLMKGMAPVAKFSRQQMVCVTFGLVCLTSVSGYAQGVAPARPAPAPATTPPPVQVAAGVTPPADYVIGPDDVLSIVFWKEPDMTRDVVVRPDGMITLPLVNDLPAVGLTPDQLRVKVTTAAEKFILDPNVNVIVKEIKSRRVFITGQVGRSGPFPLLAPTTVASLIALAGGLSEFADEKNIVILRTDKGQQVSMKFNYADIKKGKNLRQNIELRSGDIVIVP